MCYEKPADCWQEGFTRHAWRCGLISASKLTSRSMLAGGGTPIDIGGGSTASGGRLADEADRRCRCRVRTALWSWHADAPSARTSPAQLRTLLSPGFAWANTQGSRARHILRQNTLLEASKATLRGGASRHRQYWASYAIWCGPTMQSQLALLARRVRHRLPAQCPPRQPSPETRASCRCWTGAAPSAPVALLPSGCLWPPHACTALAGVRIWYTRPFATNMSSVEGQGTSIHASAPLSRCFSMCWMMQACNCMVTCKPPQSGVLNADITTSKTCPHTCS